MKHILDRLHARSDKDIENKEIYDRVYNDLLNKYYGKEPEFKDIYQLIFDFTEVLLSADKERFLRLITTVELYNYKLEQD